MTMNFLFEIHLQFLHRLEGDGGLAFSPSKRVMMKLWSLTAGAEASADAGVESLWNTWA